MIRSVYHYQQPQSSAPPAPPLNAEFYLIFQCLQNILWNLELKDFH